MKKIKNILYTCLLSAALFSCADDDMPAGSLQVKEGIPVTLTLSYQMLDDIKVTSRAAADGETGSNETTATNKPDDYGLQIFIFNIDGVLTGYKSLTKEEFHYSEEEKQSVSIETLTGQSYIYAVANYNSNRYKVNGLTFIGEKPSITREKFLELTFERDERQLEIHEKESQILMSGRYQDETQDGTNSVRNVNDDGSCTIALGENGKAVIRNSTGTIDNTPIIYLKRVVSKVTFNITCSDKDVEFKPLNYEIHNIAQSGNLLGYLPKEIAEKNRNITDYKIEEGYVCEKFFTQESPNSFTLYIPENLQKVKADKNCGSWHDRETNSYDNGKKTFTNAPDNGTYVVIKGTYHDKNSMLVANVEYTIHLGDFGGTKFNNFDNERNCEYTYNVTVHNVNEITVEATKTPENENPEYPGTEGLVINYSGKAYMVDSHYEAVIMQIYKSEKTVKGEEDKESQVIEYKFMVETPWDGMSNLITINSLDKENTINDKLNGLDVNWLSFALVSDVKGAIGNSFSSDSFIPDNTYWTAMYNMKYDSNNPKGGNVPFLAYTYTKNNGTDNLKSFQEFFSYLTNDKNWESNETYKDVICFIDEYYYSDDKYAIDIAKEQTKGTKTSRPWNEYTNTTPRSFYLIETVAVSPDGHSTYMKATHSISQHSIQTFYNPNKASEIMAYGCEYINNEESFIIDNSGVPQTTPDNYSSDNINGYDYWDGRKNTMQDIGNFTSGTTKWATILVNDKNVSQPNGQTFLRWAFVDRNRDLNRNGNIEQDEIRWYTPTIPQYCGFWMGEDAIATEARLYNGKLTDVEFMKLSINSPYNENPTTDPYQNLKSKYYRHYYSSTPKLRVFWAEEGSTYGPIDFDTTTQNENYKARNNALFRLQDPRYVRCIRNLGINNNGVSEKEAPAMYYSYKDMTFDLSNMDPKTLRTGNVLTTSLAPHAERQREGENNNNNLARIKFELAEKRKEGREINENKMEYNTIQEINLGDWYANNTLTPNTYTPIQLQQDENRPINKGVWRIPNQKELCLIALETSNQKLNNPSITTEELLGYTYDACATFCTNLKYRLGYYIRYSNTDNNVYLTAMIGSFGADENFKRFRIRPVRDIAE